MFGLTEKEIKILYDCIYRQKNITKAVVFGSRAMGNYKRGSDIDIALFGEGITFKTLSLILDDIEETSLPYEIDIIIFEKISNEKLKDHILTYGKELK